MQPGQVVANADSKFKRAIEHFEEELKKIRTGRAHPSMLDGVTVEAYGVQMPMIQVGTVTAPEGQLLQISPFDPNNLQAIATAIRDNPSLGLNPSDDGRVVRVPIPPLTEDRRREIAKTIGSKAEECNIALRGIRHEAVDAIEEAKKSKVLGEDEAKRLKTQVEDLMNKHKAALDVVLKAKESEIMTV